MARTSPSEATASFLEAFNSGDVEGIVSHYTSDAVFVQADGTEVRGHAAIRETLTGFMAMKPRLEMHKVSHVICGDVATNMAKWTLDGTGPDGPVHMEGGGFDIMQRQSDGSWKMVIDNPWGPGALG
jgi:uncharacterized protein (TIGR02246 family)